MKYAQILILFFVQILWSQQSSDPLILQADTLDLGQKPILLEEVVVSKSSLSEYELVLSAKKVM